MTTDQWAIFLNGSYGVGKSSALDHVGDLLFRSEQPFTLMDVDWFHRSWPPADFDAGNTVIEARNMAAAWANFRSVGPRRLVISGVIATPEDRERYSTAFGLDVRPVRLVATDETAEARLRRRYTADQDQALQWHLENHRQMSKQLATADLDETTIDTDALSPHQVATAVLTHFGLWQPEWKNERP